MWGVGEGGEKEVTNANFMIETKMKTLTEKISNEDKRAIQETIYLVNFDSADTRKSLTGLSLGRVACRFFVISFGRRVATWNGFVECKRPC